MRSMEIYAGTTATFYLGQPSNDLFEKLRRIPVCKAHPSKELHQSDLYADQVL